MSDQKPEFKTLAEAIAYYDHARDNAQRDYQDKKMDLEKDFAKEMENLADALKAAGQKFKCTDCGQPLPPEDIAASEIVCLECTGTEFMAGIDLDGPLAATVRVRLNEANKTNET